MELCWRVVALTAAAVLVCCGVETVRSETMQANNPNWEADWNAIAQEALNEALRRQPNTNVARNVIMFLGDGMGPTTVTAGRIYSGQLRGETGEEAKLAFDNFPNVALAKTYNVNAQVPDSAGTATAFLCGVKANIGVIGVTQNVLKGNCSTMSETNNVDSILQWSQAAGKRVGIVTTTRVTHATPAGAYAHTAHRDWESDYDMRFQSEEDRANPLCRDIAYQLVNNNSHINVILGGGRQQFRPRGSPDYEYPTNTNYTGSRPDNVDLIQHWITTMTDKWGDKASFVWNKTAFDNIPEQTEYLFGLFEPGHMRYALDNHNDVGGEPTLTEMTKKAIDILSRGPNGYFLLVEGGRIDHAHHDNRAKNALHDLVDMNNAVELAVNMTSENDTLIVVTADHSHVFTMGGYPSRGNNILGLTDQEDAAGVPELDKRNLTYVTLMYANGPSGEFGHQNLSETDTTANNFRQPSHVWLSSETHGGEDVGVYARGPMAHLFHGVQEQHYIAHAMAYAACVGANKAHCSPAAPTTPTVSGATSVVPSLPLWLLAAVSYYALNNH